MRGGGVKQTHNRSTCIIATVAGILTQSSYGFMVKYACDRGEEVGGDNTSLFNNRKLNSLIAMAIIKI
jgi:hypothetical protein